jgi:hypothetical protein
MDDHDSTAPSVFISYSHESPGHQDTVLKLANRLRGDGVDAQIDQYEVAPGEGWTRWMRTAIKRSDFVLVICTNAYRLRAEGGGEPDAGRGVNREGLVIDQAIYDAEGRNTKFIGVIFRESDRAFIPDFLRPYQHESTETEEGYEKLYRRLTNQPEILKPKLGLVRSLPPRNLKSTSLEPMPPLKLKKTSLDVEADDLLPAIQVERPVTPEELRRLFDLYRTCQLSTRYYRAQALRFFMRANVLSVIVVASSCLTVGLLLISNHRIAPTACAAVSALIAAVIPVWAPMNKAANFKSLYGSYSQLLTQIGGLIQDIRRSPAITPAQSGAALMVYESYNHLQSAEDADIDKKLLRKIFDEVNREIPPDYLWTHF